MRWCDFRLNGCFPAHFLSIHCCFSEAPSCLSLYKACYRLRESERIEQVADKFLSEALRLGAVVHVINELLVGYCGKGNFDCGLFHNLKNICIVISFGTFMSFSRTVRTIFLHPSSVRHPTFFFVFCDDFPDRAIHTVLSRSTVTIFTS